jgi:hypothetical protein
MADASNVRQLNVNASIDEQHPIIWRCTTGVIQSLGAAREWEDIVDQKSFRYALENFNYVFVDFFCGLV